MNRRGNIPRPRTLAPKLSREDADAGRALADVSIPPMPRTRGECRDGPRPCPFVRCRFHLAADVTPAGSIKINFPDRDPTDIPETCALDVADRGAATLDEISKALNLTRERVRQVERDALQRLRARRALEAP